MKGRAWVGALGALAALAFGGCPGEEVAPGEDALAVVDGFGDGFVADAADAGEADGAEVDGGGEDAAGDAGADAGDGAALTAPGAFVAGTAALSEEFVFKGVWAGAPGVIVAVGNDGVVASRDAAGAWSVLTRVEGASLLNAVHGVDAGQLWAVGMNGVALAGTATSFGESGACETAADCDDGDVCTVDRCDASGACAVEPSGLPGCCGSELGRWGFEGAELAPWVVEEAQGGATWQLSTRRAASGSGALYFGDLTQEPPTYDTGAHVYGTVLSPPVALPQSGTAVLRFAVWIDSEPDVGFDALEVFVDTGAARVKVWDKASLAAIPTAGFVPSEVDLSAFGGMTVRVGASFDSRDPSLNAYEGAYLDDVVVESTCAPGGSANAQTGPTLWGVYAVARDAAWAVGRAGAIRHWDGEAWGDAGGPDGDAVWNGLAGHGEALALVGNGGAITVLGPGGLEAVDAGTANTLHAVATADGAVYWAVGDQGTVVRGSAEGWAAVPSPAVVSLRDVVALGGEEFWAVGYGGTVVRGDGAGVSLVGFPAPEVDLHAVWVDEGGTVTVTGTDGRIFEGGAAGFAELAAFHTGGELLDLWGEGGDLVAVGSGGRVVSRRAGVWSVEASGTGQALEAVFGVTGSEVWAVGRSGTIVRWDGAAWARVESATTAALLAVWGPSAGRVYAVGSGGAIVAWDGVAWANVVSSTEANLRAVHGRHGTDVWAVGAGGVVMHYNGLGWARSPVEKVAVEGGEEQEITDELHGVWAAAADDAWAVGAGGRILRWDGQLWRRFENAHGVTLRAVYGLAANDVFAVGNAGHALHFNGAEWELMPTGSVATLHAIHGDGVGQVVAVGGLGTVLTLERE